MLASTLSQETSNGELSDNYFVKCPCFEVVEIKAQSISNKSTKKQRYSCPVCSHPIIIIFSPNELGACHFYNKSYDLACASYREGCQAGETTDEEYLYNMHESLNAWSRSQEKSQEKLNLNDALENLEFVFGELKEPVEKRPTFWFEDEQAVLEMKEEEELRNQKISEKLKFATEETGLTKDKALKRIRFLLKKLRKIERLKNKLESSSNDMTFEKLNEDQKAMLDGEKDISQQLQKLDELFNED